MKTRVMFAVLASTLVGGCQTTQSFLDANQNAALQTANARGRFELNCQEIQSSVLSSKIINPAPLYGGIWRAEYTIGVRGCGHQVVYETICLDSQNCNAIADTANIDQTY